MPKKQKPTPHNSWWCDTCGGKQEMSFEQVKAHLKDVHGIDTKTTKCARAMKLHLDGAEYFQSQYEVTFENPQVKLTNSVLCLRDEGDLMRHC